MTAVPFEGAQLGAGSAEPALERQPGASKEAATAQGPMQVLDHQRLDRFAVREGVDPLDPITYSLVAGLLGLVAITASLIPAARATRVDPLVALRD